MAVLKENPITNNEYTTSIIFHQPYFKRLNVIHRLLFCVCCKKTRQRVWNIGKCICHKKKEVLGWMGWRGKSERNISFIWPKWRDSFQKKGPLKWNGCITEWNILTLVLSNFHISVVKHFCFCGKLFLLRYVASTAVGDSDVEILLKGYISQWCSLLIVSLGHKLIDRIEIKTNIKQCKALMTHTLGWHCR